MTRRSLALFASVAVAVAAVYGCASSEATESDDSNLTGSIGEARACAIEARYEEATVGDFTTVSLSALPPELKTRIDALSLAASVFSTFSVPGVGTVFAVEPSSNRDLIEFFDANGNELATRTSSDFGGFFSNVMWGTESAPVSCMTPSPEAGSVEPPEAGWGYPTEASTPTPQPEAGWPWPAYDGGRD